MITSAKTPRRGWLLARRPIEPNRPFGDGRNSSTGSGKVILSRIVFKTLEDAAPFIHGSGDDRHLHR